MSEQSITLTSESIAEIVDVVSRLVDSGVVFVSLTMSSTKELTKRMGKPHHPKMAAFVGHFTYSTVKEPTSMSAVELARWREMIG